VKLPLAHVNRLKKETSSSPFPGVRAGSAFFVSLTISPKVIASELAFDFGYKKITCGCPSHSTFAISLSRKI
jgi:hypothetical protein